ncbi:MAG TPA: class I SAM-dependent methyltransferase [Pseudogracilibacillus sp.]|nr:class I SAM-dependent methyltransferase [Pseudogracilibacillus sp.]
MFKGIIPFAHDLLKSVVAEGDIAIDATCGNGHDTLFLAKLVGDKGHVYTFDVQAQAIESAKQLLAKNDVENVSYIHDSHAKINTYLSKKYQEKVSAAVFNLGYLPRSDKSIITQADSTIAALEQLLPYIKKNGRIVLVVYHGHEGGKEEKDAVVDFAEQLDQQLYQVIRYQFINQKNNPPFVVAIEKK